MNDNKTMRSIPTVASLDAVVRRIAARLVNLEGEFSAENEDGQLAKLWESVEELNLRVLFIMNTLQMTQTLSPIADSSGKIPTRKMTALEAYMQHGGREKLIAGIEAQQKAQADAAEAAAAFQGGQQASNEGLPSAEQGGAQGADEGRNDAARADADADNGPSTFVQNPSKFSKQ
jgi:hypothetical protein